MTIWWPKSALIQSRTSRLKFDEIWLRIEQHSPAGLAPHPVMGPRLRPGGDAEAVWRSTDEPASALHGEALATQLQVGGGEQQVVHCVDPKRVVFGVYLK